MNFSVKVDTSNFPYNIIGEKPLGLEQVDRIREELELPNLPIKVIRNLSIAFHRYNVTEIVIDEKLARASGHFQSNCFLSLKVGLEKYQTFFYEKLKSTTKDTGEVTSVELVNTFDKDAFLTEWADAGYPIEWEYSEPVDEKDD